MKIRSFKLICLVSVALKIPLFPHLTLNIKYSWYFSKILPPKNKSYPLKVPHKVNLNPLINYARLPEDAGTNDVEFTQCISSTRRRKRDSRLPIMITIVVNVMGAHKATTCSSDNKHKVPTQQCLYFPIPSQTVTTKWINTTNSASTTHQRYTM